MNDYRKILFDGLWQQNTGLVALLGLCPLLAITTTVVVVLGIAWIPVMKFVAGALYQYLQAVQAYLGPPITAAPIGAIACRSVPTAWRT